MRRGRRSPRDYASQKALRRDVTSRVGSPRLEPLSLDLLSARAGSQSLASLRKLHLREPRAGSSLGLKDLDELRVRQGSLCSSELVRCGTSAKSGCRRRFSLDR